MQDDKTAGVKGSGYVADIDYTFGYYSELNPTHARFALLAAGYAAPDRFENACELGFGQGVSINMHAAASKTHWWGNDFMPQQAAFAQGLAQAAGSNATITAEAFDEFCNRPDLPVMDYIGLHGVWTWVNDAARRTILDFIGRKLRPGGIVYVSYNTQPGWANVIPVRELFMDYADAVGGAGQGQSTSQRIDTAMAFMRSLLASNPRFLAGNQQAQQQLADLVSKDKHYLAHEYFNRDWEPMSFARVAERMEPLGLQFACAGHLLEHIDALYMTAEQRAMVDASPNARVRQSVRDFVLNANFRRDYWVRGARKLEADEHRKALGEQLVMLAQLPQDVVLRVGDARLTQSIYVPILQALADLKPKCVADIAAAVKPHNVTFDQLLQALVVLVGKLDVLPAQPESHRSPGSATRLNKHVMAMAKRGAQLQYLASPVTGGALFVPHTEMLLLPDPAYVGRRVPVYRALGII